MLAQPPAFYPNEHFVQPPLPLPEPPFVPAQLTLIRQTSPQQEKVSKNGIQKNVHVVVKNTPFLLQIGLSSPLLLNSAVIDFKQLVLDIQLIYDNEFLKPVGFVKTKPCDLKSTVNERGDQVSVNAKIKVLTSQHEDMFFRIKVRALEPKTKREFNPPLEVISAPIKVISKPKQMKKRKATKRRSLNDMLVETVQRIESQQEAQQEALEQLIRSKKRKATELRSGKDFKTPHNFSSSVANVGVPQHAYTTYANVSMNTNNNNNSYSNTNNNSSSVSNWDPSVQAEEDLVEAIVQFFAAYEQLESGDRPSKIRRVMRSITTRETEQLSELFDDLTSARFDECTGEKEEKKKEYPASQEGCNCLDCPHKAELEKIDEFYKDFLLTSSEMPSFMEDLDVAVMGGKD